MANNQVRQLFNRCHGCRKWVCDSCYNEDEGLCTECAPGRMWIAKARSEAMQHNIEEAAENATVWKGKLKEKLLYVPIAGNRLAAVNSAIIAVHPGPAHLPSV